MELAYAHDHGIPWSRFIEEFDESDREHIRAHKILESDRCPSCRRFHADWAVWDPKQEAEFPVDPAPEIAHAHMCVSCAVIANEENALRESMPEGEQMPAGVSIRLSPNTPENAKKYKPTSARIQ